MRFESRQKSSFSRSGNSVTQLYGLMISKVSAFLRNIINKSRTNQQQWERILGKQLESVESEMQKKSRTSVKISSSDSSSKHIKSSLPMLVPQNYMLLWKDSSNSRNDKRWSPSLSILFDFNYNGNSLVVTLKRPLSEPFVETAQKIENKIQKLLSSRKFKENNDFSGVMTSSYSSEVPITVELPNLANIESLTLEDVMESEKFLLVGGITYEVIHEPCDISTITCAMKPIAECPVYPAVDFRQGPDSAKPIFHWYTYSPHSGNQKSLVTHRDTKIQETVELIGGPPRRFSISNSEFRWTGDCYIPSASDTGKLLFLVADLGPHSIVKCGLSKFPIDVIDEPLIFESNIEWCQTKRPSECIRLVSYNILADLYLDLSGPQESLFFPYCPKAYQMYEYRYPLLLKELLGYEMDICFLQEVDHRMQMRYLKMLFESTGSEMIFSKKQNEVTEGSVIAFNRERFELLFSKSYGLVPLLENGCCSDLYKILKSSAVSLEIFTSRPTTLQVVVLRDRKYDNIIICGNTHLHHNPKHEHVKVFQAIVAVRQLYSIRQHYLKSNPSNKIGLLFAGDFNSTPDGPVYELLSTGLLPRSSTCWNLDEKLSADNLVLLPSGQCLINLTGTDCTNHTRYIDVHGQEQGFSGCLDYIWTDSATLHRIAPRPSYELLTKYEAIPSRIAPSDHIPLLCEVKF